jgi:hypothetical protein
MNTEIQSLIPKKKQLAYKLKLRIASTAVGSHALHTRELAAIMSALFKQYELRVPQQEIGIKS